MKAYTEINELVKGRYKDLKRTLVLAERENFQRAFDVFESKFYNKNGKRYGLKIFP